MKTKEINTAFDYLSNICYEVANHDKKLSRQEVDKINYYLGEIEYDLSIYNNVDYWKFINLKWFANRLNSLLDVAICLIDLADNSYEDEECEKDWHYVNSVDYGLRYYYRTLDRLADIKGILNY